MPQSLDLLGGGAPGTELVPDAVEPEVEVVPSPGYAQNPILVFAFFSHQKFGVQKMALLICLKHKHNTTQALASML